MRESFHKHSTVSNSLGNNLQQFLRIRIWLQSTVCHTDSGAQTSYFPAVYLHLLKKISFCSLEYGTQLCWVCHCLIKFCFLYGPTTWDYSKGNVSNIPEEVLLWTGSCSITDYWLCILPKMYKPPISCALNAVWSHLEADFPLSDTCF